MRLIDADKVDEIINKEIESTHAHILHDTQINIKFAVKNLPTVYDTQKVIEQIELLQDNICNDKLSTDDEKTIYCDACQRILKIVKDGGLND